MPNECRKVGIDIGPCGETFCMNCPHLLGRERKCDLFGLLQMAECTDESELNYWNRELFKKYGKLGRRQALRASQCKNMEIF